VPKWKNRWGEEELRRQAERRPLEFYRDFHRRGVKGEVGAEEIAACNARLEKLLDRMEAMLAKGPWLAGRDISLADIGVAPYLFRMLALGLDPMWAPSRRPRVGEWYARVSARPAYKTAVSWPDETGGGYEEVGLTTKR
jgi:glutathione S-transferase